MLEEKKLDDEQDFLEGDEDDDLTPFMAALEDDESESDEDDDNESDEEDDDDDNASVDVLKDRLKKRNHTIALRQKALKRMQSEIDELKQGSQVTPELLARLIADKNTANDDNSGMELIELKERVEEDPSSIIDILTEMLTKTENKVAAVLERRDQVLMNKVKAPLPNDLQQIVGRLAKMEQYEGFTDEQLEIVARDIRPLAKKKLRPPASTGTGGRKGMRTKEPTQSDLEKRYSKELEEMGL